jgi:hypothetical protein
MTKNLDPDPGEGKSWSGGRGTWLLACKKLQVGETGWSQREGTCSLPGAWGIRLLGSGLFHTQFSLSPFRSPLPRLTHRSVHSTS